MASLTKDTSTDCGDDGNYRPGESKNATGQYEQPTPEKRSLQKDPIGEHGEQVLWGGISHLEIRPPGLYEGAKYDTEAAQRGEYPSGQ